AEAVALARCRSGLAVGLHLVVVNGRAALPPGEISRLVNTAGHFRGGPVSAGLRYQFSGVARRQLEREIRAQLERFCETGLPLSHVDGHHHMHLHPVVLATLVNLAEEFRIPAIRLPSEELGLALALDRRGTASKVLWSGIFRCLRRHGERRLREAGVGFSERVYGLLVTGRVTEDYLLGLIPRVTADRVELYCHPAVSLPGEPSNGPPGAGREELAALVSDRVREAVTRSGFVLSKQAAAALTSAS
ncbi:MAG TPA: ChbG/HpnK family deacetylase, partial [Thermoanaerobaculia bacterium]|nr:ChbG/HpnK family deacetylase [Thermoanaerobaculia bacterium]